MSENVMMKRYQVWLLSAASFVLLFLCTWFAADGGRSASAASAAALSGSVVDHNGPVAGARVRVQGSREFAVTDKAGLFVIPAVTP